MNSIAEALAVLGLARSLASLAPARDSLLSPTPVVPNGDPFPLGIEDTELADVTVKLFTDGHYALAVEQAYKCLDRRVSQKTGIGKSGQALMFEVFSKDSPSLRLNKLRTVSDTDEQEGFRFIFGGCMQAIRNPRAHDHLFLDERDDALVMILWADYLLRRVEAAKTVRKTKKAKK